MAKAVFVLGANIEQYDAALAHHPQHVGTTGLKEPPDEKGRSHRRTLPAERRGKHPRRRQPFKTERILDQIGAGYFWAGRPPL
jgi:hypothetical protein